MGTRVTSIMLASTVAKMRLPALSLIINRPFRVSIDLTVYGLISGKLTKSTKKSQDIAMPNELDLIFRFVLP